MAKAKAESDVIVKGKIQSPEAIDKMKQELNEANSIIHKCLDSFLDVLVQLAIVQENELWQVGEDKQGNRYTTFEQYTEGEFGFKRAYLCRLRKAGETYKWLKDKWGEKEIKRLPKSPSFYMTLEKIPENDRISVIQTWETEKGKRTASRLKSIWQKAHPDQTLNQEETITDYNKKIKTVLGVLTHLKEDISNHQYEHLGDAFNELKEIIKTINTSLNGNNKTNSKTSETDKQK